MNARGELKIIEINADYPDGLILHDSTVSVIWQEKSTLHADNFLQFFEKEKHIFIAYPENAFFRDAYYREYELLKENGFNIFIGNYSELERKGDELFFENTRIDTIRRDIEIGKMKDKDYEKLIGANVNYINTFDIRAVGYKDLLAKISHPLVPKTTLLTDENADQIAKNRENYVLKPTNLYEWIGVIIGKNTTDEMWNNAIQKEKNSDYIAQEFVDSKKILMNFYDENTIISKEVYFDICPHFFVKNWKIFAQGHTLVRFSENPILNVAQGGGIWYLKS